MAPRTPTRPSGGAAQGRGGRNRSVSRASSSGSSSSDKTKQSLDDLTDIVFDVGDNRVADQYVTAKKRLVEYVGSTFEQGANISMSIKTGILVVIPMPIEPVTAIITPAIAATPAVAAIPGFPGVPAVAFQAAVIADPQNNIQAVPAIQAVAAIPARAAVAAIAAVPGVAAVREDMSTIQKMMLSGQVKNYLYQQQKLEENVKKAFTITLKQCTVNLKSKLEQSPEWALLSVNNDVLALMELIRSMVFKYEERQHQVLSLHRVKQSYYSFRQGNLSNVDYLQAFKNRHEMANSHGVVLYDKEVAIMMMKRVAANAGRDFDNDLTDLE